MLFRSNVDGWMITVVDEDELEEENFPMIVVQLTKMAFHVFLRAFNFCAHLLGLVKCVKTILN